MAINYSLVKLASKFGDKAGVPLFYARAQMKDSISLKKFAKLISMQTTVSYADVTAVLVSMQENMVIELQRGNQIDFGELGKFRLQLTSEGAATAAEFKSDINIKGVNIQFIPGSDLANIFVGMEFEQVASRAVQKAALKAEKEGAKTLDIEEAKKKPAKDNAPSGGDTTGGNLYTIKPVKNKKEMYSLLFNDLRIDEDMFKELNFDDFSLYVSVVKE